MLPDAAAAVFDALDLTEMAVDGRRAWLPSAVELPATRPGGVRLLPHFDAYLVGCHPRPMLFPGQAAERALNRGSAGQVPVLLVDGVAAGIWQHRRSGRKLALTVEPFAKLPAAQRAELDEQAERLGEFTNAVSTVTVGPVTARPHR
jgi:hypothetical protein